ncbi:MAG: hypothetical protein IID38_11960, partial [Planctomycetes bacterium]|nr:hypothetical protein [Planctomycetota bacterium]
MMLPKEVTTDYCGHLAHSIQECFERHKIQILPGCDMRLFLDEILWLAGHDDVFNHAVSKDKTRSLQAFSKVCEAVHVEKALRASIGIPKIEDRLNYLAKRPRSEVGQNITGMGWELLYELEVAGKLSNANWTLSFDEPDIVATAPDTRFSFGFACKRPRARESISGCLKKAAAQMGR